MATINLPDRYLAASVPSLAEGARLPATVLPGADGDGVDLRYLLALFRRRLSLFVMVVALCVMLALNVTMAMPRLYRANADVVMNRDRTELVRDGRPADPSLTAPPRAEEIDTETKVIGSRDLAQRVAEALRLDRDEAFLADMARGGLWGRLRAALDFAPAEPADRRRAVIDALLARVSASRLDNAYAIRIAYSQIANPVYLLRKRTIPPRLAWRLMLRNLAANLARSLWPEPYVDRIGRLRGNLAALADLARGCLHPGRVLEL